MRGEKGSGRRENSQETAVIIVQGKAVVAWTNMVTAMQRVV